MTHRASWSVGRGALLSFLAGVSCTGAVAAQSSTRIELRVEPAVDLYYHARALASDREAKVPAPYQGAVDALPALAEQNLGAWHGRDRAAFYAERRIGTHMLWLAEADELAPGGESFADLVERVAPAIDRLNVEHRGRDIVAVAHGGTIRAAVGVALGLAPQASLAFSTANCSLTRLDHLATNAGGGLWRVVAVNRLLRPRAADSIAPGAL